MDHSEHFSREELSCRCCGKCDMTLDTLRLIEKIRVILGDVPMVVTSGFRCAKHNREVGGVSDPRNPSKHTLGMAVDFVPRRISIDEAYGRILNAYDAGYIGEMGGIGYYPKKGFIHVDTYHAEDGHLRKW